ncbi:MAG: RluA family pseudouridine synthase [Acidaminobacteraceae bacterium]
MQKKKVIREEKVLAAKPIFEKYEFVVDEDSTNIRLDVYLNELLNDQSRSYIQTLVKEGYIKVNGEIKVAKNYKVNLNDKVVIGIPEPEELKIEAQDIPITIVYEDDDVIVVDKPAGMVVHPAPGNYDGTLVNALLFHCKNLSSINGVIRPGIVHRIDKDTSGLIMVAKNNHAHNHLAAQLKDHSSTRSYIAIVHGRFRQNEGTVDAPIARNPKDRLRMAVVHGGRESVTHYSILKRYEAYTVVRCNLETGRTHQIRVHMAHIKHPLLGDVLYGPKIRTLKIKVEGQMLHAETLGFIHPTTNEYMEFKSELPENFDKVFKKIEAVEN